MNDKQIISKDTISRFWKKVKKTDTCWIWTGAHHPEGYGSWGFNKISCKPHRFSYELVHGRIPKGLVIDHICRVRDCVNPSHLRAVTNRENLLSGDGPTRINSVKTHCRWGHPYSKENTKVYPGKNGKNRNIRYCILCDKFKRDVIAEARKRTNKKFSSYKSELDKKIEGLKVLDNTDTMFKLAILDGTDIGAQVAGYNKALDCALIVLRSDN